MNFAIHFCILHSFEEKNHTRKQTESASAAELYAVDSKAFMQL